MDLAKQCSNLGFTRLEIFTLVKDLLKEDVNVMFDVLGEAAEKKTGFSYTWTDYQRQVVRKLIFDLKSRWKENRRTETRFLEKNEEWLSKFVPFRVEAPQNPDHVKTGRPTSDFSFCSERTKRRRTELLRTESSLEELSYATQMSLRADGKIDAATVVRDVTLTTPSRAHKYRQSMQRVPEKSLTAEGALSLMIETNQSRSSYERIRQACTEINCRAFPPYNQVAKAKLACYPVGITVSDRRAEVRLQSLLDHTVHRILQHQSEVIKRMPAESFENLVLTCKWGYDGSSGQSNYKQKFVDSERNEIDDSSILLTSVVPLQLSSFTGKEEIITWKNPRPSSPRFCRPISIEFLKETTDVIRTNVHTVQCEVDNLVPFNVELDGQKIKVAYKMGMTMIDGKVCNVVSDISSSQRCHLCQATSKEFNDIDEMMGREIAEQRLTFGLSTLHAWIRCFECFIHLSYRLHIKSWQVREPGLKAAMEIRKKSIQEGFRSHLGLIVDRPKQSFGSSNDGNTARRFFENSSVSASITGLDLNLIKRMHTILQVISCDHQIDVDIFEEYAIETARLFVRLYPWFNMPTTVHKLLVHGKEVIRNSLLPIGQMSEEAQEACNKYFKRFREDFARKCSRRKNMQDVFSRLLIFSDPLISSQRPLPKKKLQCLSNEALLLIIPPSVTMSEASCSSSSTSPEVYSDNSSDDCD